MKIGLLNTKIVFQEKTTTVDSIGNTQNTWTDHYTCFATVSGESGKEQFVAESTAVKNGISFTVRYCSYLNGVHSDTHRIKFNSEKYNILEIDHLNYKKKAIKFICQKERI